jgi:uncharacterized protein (DUF2267 family)
VGEETFLELVEQAADITRAEAREAVCATLRTLAERITRGEAEDVAVFVPGEFRVLLTSGRETAERFGVDELVRRVAKREGVDGRTAVEHVRAVFTALGQAASPDALSNLAAQLSADFDPLLEAAWRRRGSATPPARAGGLRADERRGEALDRLPVGCASANSAPRRLAPTPSRRVFGAYQAVDQAFQRIFEVDARLLYGFVVPIIAVSGLVVLLAFDPSNWLLALAVVLLLLASLIVMLGIARMLSDDGDATG